MPPPLGLKGWNIWLFFFFHVFYVVFYVFRVLVLCMFWCWVGFSSMKNVEISSNGPVPPLVHFKGKNKNPSSLAGTICASRVSFFAILTTFKRHSGLKIFPFSKLWFWKRGDCQNVQSHMPWGDDKDCVKLHAMDAPLAWQWCTLFCTKWHHDDVRMCQTYSPCRWIKLEEFIE